MNAVGVSKPRVRKKLWGGTLSSLKGFSGGGLMWGKKELGGLKNWN